MPDWSYRTLFRPMLFRLPAATARDLCLGLMGTLARLPLGPALIDLLGHMRPDARLARSFLGVTFPSPVGLGPGIDVRAAALPALARFGFGFLEVGPVTVEPHTGTGRLARRCDEQAIFCPDPPAKPGLEAVARRLAGGKVPLPVPLVVRLGIAPGTGPEKAAAECAVVVRRLAPHAAFFSLCPPHDGNGPDWPAESWRHFLQELRAQAAPRPLLLCLAADLDAATGERLLAPALELGAAGVVIDGTVAAPGGRLLGLPARGAALTAVSRLRQRFGSEMLLIASGGLHEPEDALRLLEAGANLVQIDSGLVYAGPGLPKRVNEAVLYATAQEQGPPAARLFELSWFWVLLLGVSMLLGGVLAGAIAATHVVLPYDEVFSGMTRAQLAAVNGRLLAFMAHDRVSLAGTMIAVGVFYVGFAVGGIRRGVHWAWVSVLASAFAGFGSFFLFLGFGYFDPFHAFVTAVLFQFLLLALHSRLSPAREPAAPGLRNDRAWHRGLWGQLLFVLHGAALLGAGAVISVIGATFVFVPEDLEFMGTTAEALASANPRLVPLVAHDRACLGGMLIASGLVVLLSALWGYRRGRRWLWWSYAGGGTAAYAAAVGVHLAVGYTSAWHLLPALLGSLLLLAGLVLSYPYLCGHDPAHEAAWRRHRPGPLCAS
jgi:dihydroorotate dehydrogenase